MLELPELEQRLSNLQSQVERLWRKAEANVPPIEQRLAAMADQYAEYLKRWAATVERHTNAVAQLEAYAGEWKDASTRVRQETSERLHELETTIEREWDTLKQMQEEPIRELREQAESLTQVSLAMANASQQGVERAEARFAAFETEVHLRLNELTRELTTALAEMKARIDRQQGSRDPSTQWSLDDVTRLHGQLRDGTRATGQFPHTIDHESVTGPPELPSPDAGESGDRPQSETVTIGGRPAPGSVSDTGTEDLGIPRKWAVAVGVLGFAVVLAGVFGWRMQGQITAATERAAIAEKTAIVAVTDARKADQEREAAADQLAEMREIANRAQRIGSVTAAPDLIRFNLFGLNGASGDALFSRSRGIVVNGSGLPTLPSNRTFQAWLLTPTAPVKVGTLVVEPDGSLILVQQTPIVPRRVVGVMVTEESSDAGDTPSGAPVLSSVVRALEPPAEAQP